MIAIVDYGLGNLGSIQNMLKKLGHQAQIITNPAQLADATQIILPGVGAFDSGMQHLADHHWIEPLNKRVLVDKIPTLGICLGMQLMTRSSEEGTLPGLGWVNAATIRFNADGGLRIPHMGWNKSDVMKQSRLLPMDGQERRYYFVHSYFVKLDNEADQLLRTEYGAPFTAGFEVDNVIGVQFHPEKSHRFGMELLRNFATNFHPQVLDAQVKGNSVSPA